MFLTVNFYMFIIVHQSLSINYQHENKSRCLCSQLAMIGMKFVLAFLCSKILTICRIVREKQKSNATKHDQTLFNLAKTDFIKIMANWERITLRTPDTSILLIPLSLGSGLSQKTLNITLVIQNYVKQYIYKGT